MSKRSIAILLQLRDSHTPIRIKQLSALLQVSSRTVWNDLEFINAHLARLGLSPLSHSTLGVTLAPDVDLGDSFHKLIHSIQSDTSFICADVRPRLVLCTILTRPGIHIEQLCDQFQVSQSTILSTLRNMRSEFAAQDLKMLISTKNGVSIQCTESRRRVLLVDSWKTLILCADFFSIVKADQISSLFNTLLPLCFSSQQIELLHIAYQTVLYLETSLKVNYSDIAFCTLCYHLVLCLSGTPNQQAPLLQHEICEILSTYDYPFVDAALRACAQKYSFAISANNIIYLTLLVLCTNTDTVQYFRKENQIKLQVCSADILKAVLEELQISLVNDELLERLCEYLSHSYYRCRFAIPDADNAQELGMEVQPQLGTAVKNGLLHFEQLVAQPIPESECNALIALLSASLVRSSNMSKARYHVALVTTYGPTVTAHLLYTLSSAFPEVIVKTVMSLHLFEHSRLPLPLDLIITTTPLSGTIVPNVVVSPKLESNDLQLLRTAIDHLCDKHIVPRDEGDTLLLQVFEALHKYYGEPELLQLHAYLSAEVGFRINKYFFNRGDIMLKDMLTAQTVRLNQHADTWVEAVELGGQVLLSQGCVEERFIDAMVTFIKENGPYIVIAPGIAMPHARPEDGVKKLSASLITLDTPVSFGHESNDPVRIVICIAAVNNCSHLKALSELMKILGDEDKQRRILTAQRVEEIVSLFDQ